MRLPRPRDLGTQTVLWDWVDDVQFDSVLSTRTYIGDFFEEATVQLYKHLGARRLVTDAAADICPDIELAVDKGWIEVKSLGIGSNVIIYEHSLERYKRLKQYYPDREIFFALWTHRFQMRFASRLGEMQQKLATLIDSVLIVPLEEVLKVTSAIEPAPLRIRSEGPNQITNAWRLPKEITNRWYSGQQRIAHDISVYNAPVFGLTVLDESIAGIARVPV